MTEQHDERSRLALACEWSARTTAISMEMVVPALIGYWLDRRLGTSPLCLLVGVGVGFLTAMLSLLQLAKTAGKKNDPPTQK